MKVRLKFRLLFFLPSRGSASPRARVSYDRPHTRRNFSRSPRSNRSNLFSRSPDLRDLARRPLAIAWHLRVFPPLQGGGISVTSHATRSPSRGASVSSRPAEACPRRPPRGGTRQAGAQHRLPALQEGRLLRRPFPLSRKLPPYGGVFAVQFGAGSSRCASAPPVISRSQCPAPGH
jgi:hypothetical protein